MLPIAGMMFLVFFPASLGILRQAIVATELAHQLLALGIFLFSIEQARMANEDLQKIFQAKKIVQDTRLDTFLIITIITIVIELLGFYISSIDPGWGSIIILISQIWFNLFASVKINYYPETTIQPWKISERIPVLFADFLGIFLVSIWMLDIADLWISCGLVSMLMIYLSVKLVLFLKNTVLFQKTRKNLTSLLLKY